MTRAAFAQATASREGAYAPLFEQLPQILKHASSFQSARHGLEIYGGYAGVSGVFCDVKQNAHFPEKLLQNLK